MVTWTFFREHEQQRIQNNSSSKLMHTLTSCVQTVGNWADPNLRLRGGRLEAAFHSLFSTGGLYGCLYLLWRTRAPMNKYKMTGRHASDIRDNGKTWELPAPGSHGCYAVQPTILIAADRNRDERMTSGGSVCLRSSQDQAASLPVCQASVQTQRHTPGQTNPESPWQVFWDMIRTGEIYNCDPSERQR